MFSKNYSKMFFEVCPIGCKKHCVHDSEPFDLLYLQHLAYSFLSKCSINRSSRTRVINESNHFELPEALVLSFYLRYNTMKNMNNQRETELVNYRGSFLETVLIHIHVCIQI